MTPPETAQEARWWLLDFRVIGTPYPWKTPRRDRRRRSGTFKDPNLAGWQDAVRWDARAALGRPWGQPDSLGAWRLEVDVRVERPPTHLTKAGGLRKGKPVYPIRRTGGDLTNHVKAVEDALSGWVWKDDCQVVELGDCSLRYASPGLPPGCDVRVRRVEP